MMEKEKFRYSYNQDVELTQNGNTLVFGEQIEVDGGDDIEVKVLAKEGYAEFIAPNGDVLRLLEDGSYNLNSEHEEFIEYCYNQEQKLNWKERVFEGMVGTGETALGVGILVGTLYLGKEKVLNAKSAQTGIILGLSVFGDGLSRLFVGGVAGRKLPLIIDDINLPATVKNGDGTSFTAFSFSW